MRARFGPWRDEAAAGALDGWAAEPRGALAQVILLDQVSRVMHRGSGEAFACDALARAGTREALGAGRDRLLRPIERVFLYMPLMHSEDLDDHLLAVALFRSLADAMAGRARAGAYRGSLRAAEQHRAIVERFGRYPHRDEALARESSAEELAFLEQPGSSFSKGERRARRVEDTGLPGEVQADFLAPSVPPRGSLQVPSPPPRRG